MKRLIALVLVAVLCVAAFAMTGCKDPLKAKGEELDATYAKLGTAYQNVVYWTSLAGVYGSEDAAYAELNAKFAQWKSDIQDAGDVVDKWLDLDEDQMNQYIANWTSLMAEIQTVIDEYEIVEETEAPAETVAP